MNLVLRPPVIDDATRARINRVVNKTLERLEKDLEGDTLSSELFIKYTQSLDDLLKHAGNDDKIRALVEIARLKAAAPRAIRASTKARFAEDDENAPYGRRDDGTPYTEAEFQSSLDRAVRDIYGIDLPACFAPDSLPAAASPPPPPKPSGPHSIRNLPPTTSHPGPPFAGPPDHPLPLTSAGRPTQTSSFGGPPSPSRSPSRPPPPTQSALRNPQSAISRAPPAPEARTPATTPQGERRRIVLEIDSGKLPPTIRPAGFVGSSRLRRWESPVPPWRYADDSRP